MPETAIPVLVTDNPQRYWSCARDFRHTPNPPGLSTFPRLGRTGEPAQDSTSQRKRFVMPLDPKAKALIDMMAQMPLPPWSELNAVTFRAMMDAGRFPPPELPLAEIANSTIPGPAGPIAVRIYRASLEPGQPVIVYFHGGGFVIGNLESHDGTCRRLSHGI